MTITIDNRSYAPGDRTPAGFILRRSGYPYALKPSPSTPRPPKRYRNVTRLDQLNKLLEP